MFAFTNRFGDTIDTPALDDLATLEPTDVKYLPLWVQAAVTAEENNFCEYYDRLAASMGGPTRDDLKAAGLLPAHYAVTLTRRVPVTVWIAQTADVLVMANSEDEAQTKALAPSVAYWSTGMYSSQVDALIEERYGYVTLDVAQAGEPTVREVRKADDTDTGI
jgi:hypothetical protein